MPNPTEIPRTAPGNPSLRGWKKHNIDEETDHSENWVKLNDHRSMSVSEQLLTNPFPNLLSVKTIFGLGRGRCAVTQTLTLIQNDLCNLCLSNYGVWVHISKMGNNQLSYCNVVKPKRHALKAQKHTLYSKHTKYITPYFPALATHFKFPDIFANYRCPNTLPLWLRKREAFLKTNSRHLVFKKVWLLIPDWLCARL